MSIIWIDVSIPLDENTTPWPGDAPFQLKPSNRIAEGAEVNTSQIVMSTHTATHVDAPWHFEDDGKKLDQVDHNVFFGEALIIELPDVDIITAADLGDKPLPRRVLFKTRNSQLPADAPFQKDFVAVAPDASQRMVDDGVRLVGVDYLSVAPYKQPGQDTHHILLQNDVFIVEGLRLAEIPAGTAQFVCLPLPLVGADGSPCRAFVGLER